MALNEDSDWELVAAQVAKETDSEKLRELAAEFNRVLDKREQLRRQQETKSVGWTAARVSIEPSAPGGDAKHEEELMNKDQVTGKIDQAVGKVEQSVGESVGSKKLANKGVVNQAKGAVKETWGDAKDAAKQIHESHKEAASEKADRSREKVSEFVDDTKDKAKVKIEEFKQRHSA